MYLSLLLDLNLFHESPLVDYTQKDVSIEIAIMLLGAFILGFLFCRFLGYLSKKEIIVRPGQGASNGSTAALKLTKDTMSNAESISKSAVVKTESKSPAKTTAKKTTKPKLTKPKTVIAEAKNDVKSTNTNTPVSKDDLKIIEGIGPAIERLLNDNQINTFQELAARPLVDLEKILEEAGPRFRVHVPETWTDQAKLLRDGNMTAFEQMTKELKGGRRR